jgi:DNA repair photolyase
MTRKRNKLEISGQFLHCPLFLSIDTYEGCTFGCRYCFANPQYNRQNRGNTRRESIRPALLTTWERVLSGQSIGNPMIEYLVTKKHPVQLGAKADPFPRGLERKVQNTRKFLELCNKVSYPIYISTKNTGELPVDLLAEGNYVLGVSLASHKGEDIKLLETNTSDSQGRINQIPSGVFKKIVVRWQPFIPQLFRSKNGRELIDWSEIDRFLDLISDIADGVSISFLGWDSTGVRELLHIIGSEDLEDLDAVEVLTYIREQTHLRGLEFYTANYRALSDSPVCCGLKDDEFEISTRWVWAYLIKKLFDGEKEYLTVEDLKQAFPDELKDVIFDTMDVPLFSRWAHYCARKTTILEEYIKDFTYNRKMNPVNFFAGLYSKVVDGEFRIYFLDYRNPINNGLIPVSPSEGRAENES